MNVFVVNFVAKCMNSEWNFKRKWEGKSIFLSGFSLISICFKGFLDVFVRGNLVLDRSFVPASDDRLHLRLVNRPWVTWLFRQNTAKTLVLSYKFPKFHDQKTEKEGKVWCFHIVFNLNSILLNQIHVKGNWKLTLSMNGHSVFNSVKAAWERKASDELWDFILRNKGLNQKCLERDTVFIRFYSFSVDILRFNPLNLHPSKNEPIASSFSVFRFIASKRSWMENECLAVDVWCVRV